MASPFSLGSAVHYAHVCRIFNLTPSQTQPPAISCLLCKKGTLRAYPDPADGTWWACDLCGFHGLTLSLYQKARKIRDTATAWLELLREAGLQASQELLGRSAIDR